MFKQKFVDIIQKRRLRISQVAKGAGIVQSTLGSYINDGKIPSFDKAAKIAEYLDVSLDYLAGRIDNPIMPSRALDQYIIFALYGRINEETVRDFEEVKRLVQLQKDRINLSVFKVDGTGF